MVRNACEAGIENARAIPWSTSAAKMGHAVFTPNDENESRNAVHNN